MEMQPTLLYIWTHIWNTTQSYVSYIICLAAGQPTFSLFILRDIMETAYVLTALMLQGIMKWHFSSAGVALKEMCHCSLDNKVALCTKTNPLRPFYPPWGHLSPVGNWEKQGEGKRDRDRQTQRERARERPVVSYVWMWICKDAPFSNTLVVIWLSDLLVFLNCCTWKSQCVCSCIYV